MCIGGTGMLWGGYIWGGYGMEWGLTLKLNYGAHTHTNKSIYISRDNTHPSDVSSERRHEIQYLTPKSQELHGAISMASSFWTANGNAAIGSMLLYAVHAPPLFGRNTKKNLLKLSTFYTFILF